MTGDGNMAAQHTESTKDARHFVLDIGIHFSPTVTGGIGADV